MFAKFTPLFALTLMLAAPAAKAQFEMPLTQPHFIILISAPVQEHLKLTDEQKKSIDKALESAVQKDGDRVMVTLGPDTDMKELDKEALKPLDDNQRKRLNELWLQRNGLLALEDKDTAKTLSVTEEQMKKIQDVFADHRQKLEDLFMSMDSNGGTEVHMDQKKVASLREATDKKISALLTEDQVKTWKEMLGEKFDFKDGKGSLD
ncbi:MAG: hypothetical protein JSS66_04180 [Armatimonadetes bacterium]|nr:hypothetical protein [Armatimonadota bacterium]